MNTFNNQLINASICVTDLTAADIKQADNGKKYLNITIAARKELDQQGNNATVYVTQSKEQRAAKAEKKYIGGAKHIVFTENVDAENLPTAADMADLPF